MSNWAMQQARLLGLQDEEEAKREAQHHSMPSSIVPAAQRRKSSLSRRYTMDHSSSRSVPSADSFSRIAPTLDSSSLLTSSPNSGRKNNVDVDLLKSMNMQFLQTLMAQKHPIPSTLASSSHLDSSGGTKHLTSTEDAVAPSGKDPSQQEMSLNALMLNSGNSRLLLHHHHQQFPQQQQQHLMTAMRRRHSLDLDTVERNERIMSQPFLAIRRDSLHGLGHSSS
jgi:hypothetical protein